MENLMKKENNTKLLKELVDVKIENDYVDGFQFGEEDNRTIPEFVIYEDIKECLQNGGLEGYIFNEEDWDNPELDFFEILGVDFREIYDYYVQKLCDYFNLNYRLANNRTDYVVYPKENV